MSDAAQKIQTSRLLYLPGEIRNMIMKYVFYYEPGTGPLPVSQTPLMTLPLTCRQLHAEYQNMALSSTLFYIPWSSMGADVLPGIVDRLPSMSRSAIKKLYTRLPMVQGDCIGSLLPGPNTRFIEFESAGLGQVEQLYLSYPARYRRGDNALFGLGRIMNRCLRDKKLVKLRKLCVGHYAAAYDLGLIEFSHHLTRRKDTLCKRWDVEPGLNNGQIFLVGKGQMTSRRVAIMLGYTQYEAENYCLIRQQLKKVCRPMLYPFTYQLK